MLNQLESGVSLSRLCQIEATTQSILEHEPEDTAARLRLAWCLLGRAFHRAGQDTISNGKADSAEGVEQLLQQCLHHATIIMQVSACAQERQQASSLRSLVEMAGGYPAIQKSEEEEDMILQDILSSLRETPQMRPSRRIRLGGRRRRFH